MRLNLDNKTTKSYISRDRLIGEVERMLDRLYGQSAQAVRWVDVPLVNDKMDAVQRWTAVVFVTEEQRWCMAAIAGHGFLVIG